MLERILYVSRAAAGTELSDISEIAQAARLRNAAGRGPGRALGGARLHRRLDRPGAGGTGPALCATYTRILKDPRHVQISLRARERIYYRQFGAPGLILRSGPSISPAILARFDYHFGFPVEGFPADALLEFMAETCRPALPAASGAAQGAAQGAAPGAVPVEIRRAP